MSILNIIPNCLSSYEIIKSPFFTRHSCPHKTMSASHHHTPLALPARQSYLLTAYYHFLVDWKYPSSGGISQGSAKGRLHPHRLRFHQHLREKNFKSPSSRIWTSDLRITTFHLQSSALPTELSTGHAVFIWRLFISVIETIVFNHKMCKPTNEMNWRWNLLFKYLHHKLILIKNVYLNQYLPLHCLLFEYQKYIKTKTKSLKIIFELASLFSGLICEKT